MSYSLNSLKGGLYRGLHSVGFGGEGSREGLIEGDTRSVDKSSYKYNHNSYQGFGLGSLSLGIRARELVLKPQAHTPQTLNPKT